MPSKGYLRQIYMLDGYYFFKLKIGRHKERQLGDGMSLGVRLDGQMYLWEKDAGTLNLSNNWFVPTNQKLPGSDTQLFYASDVDELLVKFREHGLDTLADQVFSTWL